MGILDAPAVTKPALDAARVLLKSGDPWWNSAFTPPSEVPAITAATTTQISGGTSIAPTANYFYDPYFRYDGCSGVVASGPGITVITGPAETVVPEIITDAADIEFKFLANRTGTGVVGVRAIVDGKLASVDMQRIDATSGTVYFYKLHFTTAKIRHLKLQVDGHSRFDGVVLGVYAVAQRPAGPHKFRHTAIGDSLTIGGANFHYGGTVDANDRFYFRFESHAYWQSVLMGCDSFVNLGSGGTGWVNPGSSQTFAGRVPLALLSNPHVLGFYGSINDSAYSSTVTAAVIATLAQVDSVPAVLVCGNQQAGNTVLNDRIRQGVIAAGRKWLDVNGVADSSSSNITAHPTLAEQKAIAAAAHAQLDMTKVIGVVEGVNAARQPSKVTLTSNTSSAVTYSTSVTFTATVISLSPAGSVQFYVDGAAVGSPVAVSDGTATYTTSSLSIAEHTITAQFEPANLTTVKASTSAPFVLAVVAAGWTPTLLPNKQFWFDAQSLGLSNGAAVSAFPDSSGNGRNLAQATSANQPVLNTTKINGHPAVVFDGTNDYLSVVLSSAVGASPWTVYFVAGTDLADVTSTDQRVFGGLDSSNSATRLDCYRTTSEAYAAARGAAATSANSAWTTGPKLIKISYDTSTVTMTVNGTVVATGAAASYDLKTFVLGARGDIVRFWNGYFGEMVAVTGLASPASDDLMFQYLNTRWGLGL